MKIALLSEWDPLDPSLRSGVPYFIAENLKKINVEVAYIPIRHGKRQIWHKVMGRIMMFIFNKVFHKKFGFYIQNRSKEYARSYAKQAEAYLQNTDCDVIFSMGTIPIAYLHTDKPIVLWLDATFANLYNYYTEFSHYYSLSLKQGHRTEKAALDKASLVIFCSEWAKNTAIQFYKCSPEKIRKIPRGANLQSPPTPQDIASILEKKDFSVCRILFVGRGWRRKGGEIVMQVCEYLYNEGLPIELHLVGSSPENLSQDHDWLFCHGSLSKSVQAQKEKLENLLSVAHFLFVPARAEAFGIVYAEASAYGVPSIGTDTGGVNSVIFDGLNGKLFPYQAAIEEYAYFIKNKFNHQESYQKLAFNAYKVYQEHFDWEKNVGRMATYIQEIIS